MAGRVIQGFFIGRGLPMPTAGQTRATASRPGLAGPPTPAFVGRIVAQLRDGPGANFGDQKLDAASLGLARGGGQQLPAIVLAKMEAAFGADFSAVRVHVGPQAARIGAVAFTTGADLYFAPGQYQPHSARGQQLIGHELAHVIQQRQGRVRTPAQGALVVRDRALEAEADRLGTLAAAYRAPGGAPVQAKMADPVSPPLAKTLTRPGSGAIQRQSVRARLRARYVLSAKTRRNATEVGVLGDFVAIEDFAVAPPPAGGFIVQLISRKLTGYLLDERGNPIKKMTTRYMDNLPGVEGNLGITGEKIYWEYFVYDTTGLGNGDQFALTAINPREGSDYESAGEYRITGAAFFTTHDPRNYEKWSTDPGGAANGLPYILGGQPLKVPSQSNILVRTMRMEWWGVATSRLTIGARVSVRKGSVSSLKTKLERARKIFG